MSITTVDLEGCDFEKADCQIIERMIVPDADIVYAGDLKGYYSLVINKNLVSDAEVPVLVRVKHGVDLQIVTTAGMKVLTVTGPIVGGLINFECFVGFLKSADVVSISLSGEVGTMD